MIGNPPSLSAFFALWSRNRGEYLRCEGDLASGRLTYSEAARATSAFATHLRASGIAQGDRIIFWAENRPEWIVALWACLLEGIVAVPIDFRSSSAMVVRIAGIVSAKAVLIGEGLHPPEGLSCPVWPLRTALRPPAARARSLRGSR